jgi:hypothetical protein
MNTRSKAALLTMAAMLAACSDTATAPEPMDQPMAESYEGSRQDLSRGDTVRFTITIDPSRKTVYYLGDGNTLTFPEGSLCDTRSSYGEKEWDKPCARAASKLAVNVTAWMDRRGHAYLDFDKHIRFVPSSNPSQWVVLTFADREASLNPFFNILYCPGSGRLGSSTCYDESKKDPSLITTRNPLTGKITRRIKHFSGYNVAAGREGEESEGFFNLAPSFSVSPRDAQLETVEDVQSAYPELSSSEAGQLLARVREAKRSGYILASG